MVCRLCANAYDWPNALSSYTSCRTQRSNEASPLEVMKESRISADLRSDGFVEMLKLTSMPHVVVDVVFLSGEGFLTNVTTMWTLTGVSVNCGWAKVVMTLSISMIIFNRIELTFSRDSACAPCE